MSADDKYLVDGQQRVLGLLLVLAGHEIEGLAPAQIAEAQQCSKSLVTRDLANLRARGFAEQIATTGRWRLGPDIVQLAVKHMESMARARRRLDETARRYSATT